MRSLAILFLAAALNTTDVKLPSGKVLVVELATSPEDLARGLAGRKSIPDSGMLFIYRENTRTKYNLAGYPAPMDILYIDENKTIINLKENVMPCRVADCSGYDSIWSHRYTLQLPAGTVKRLNIHAGDALSFNDSINKPIRKTNPIPTPKIPSQ